VIAVMSALGPLGVRARVTWRRCSCASSPAAAAGRIWISRARRGGGDDGEITKGGTGFGTRLLLH